MAAKQSAEMRLAIELVKNGWKVPEAAKHAGVWRTSLYAVLAKEKREAVEKQTEKKGR